MRELVSIIVPIYKVEEDLDDCINSLRNQTYDNLEIILVDDGSPDRCGQMADEAADKDNRIKVIHKSNGGLSDARNAGMDIMTGDYVAFVDSDDLLELDFVEHMMSLVHKYRAEMVICQNSIFTKNLGVVPQHDQESIEEKCYEASEAIKLMLYQKGIDVSAWGKIYRRDILENVRYPKGLNFEDIPTTYKAMVKCKKIAYTSKELYRYQVRENSIENEKFSPKKMDIIKTSRMMLKDIETDYPEYAAAARSRFAAAHFHVLAQINEKIPEKKIIEDDIKKVRGRVLMDPNASIRVRGACFLTYISFELTVNVLRMMNRHKYY